MKTPIVHMQSTRLFVNAGIRFPLCYANARLLDMDKGRLPTTGIRAGVTCKRCIKLMNGVSTRVGTPNSA